MYIVGRLVRGRVGLPYILGNLFLFLRITTIENFTKNLTFANPEFDVTPMHNNQLINCNEKIYTISIKFRPVYTATAVQTEIKGKMYPLIKLNYKKSATSIRV